MRIQVSQTGSTLTRKALVVTQFVLTQLLLISTCGGYLNALLAVIWAQAKDVYHVPVPENDARKLAFVPQWGDGAIDIR